MCYLFEKVGFEIVEIKALSGFWVTFGQLLVYNMYRFNRGPVKYIPVILLLGLVIQGASFLLDKIDKTDQWTWMYMVVSREKMTAREFLYKNLKADSEEYFGNTDKNHLSYVCDAWMNDTSNSAHRFDAMKSLIGEEDLKTFKILDMSSGCGSFVFYGLLNGYDVYGIEPEKWKHQFNHLKAKEKGYPDIWMERFYSGVGEFLPFKDGTFNMISTYQTLEHVQSHKRCFEEFNRVLKSGGYLFIRCPDYTSFFEGHYRVPMLPLMNKSLFKIYLKILKKPTIGLDTINYITKKMVHKLISDDDWMGPKFVDTLNN